LLYICKEKVSVNLLFAFASRVVDKGGQSEEVSKRNRGKRPCPTVKSHVQQ